MSNYYTGTVAVTNGSYIVTGTGTSFITRGIMAGDEFELTNGYKGLGDGVRYEIASVDSATQITLLQAYQGTTGSAKNYVIKYSAASETPTNTAARLATFLDMWQSKYDAVSSIVKASGIPQADSNGKISLGWMPTSYGLCTNATTTVAKTVAISNFVLTTGAHVYVEFSNGSGVASPTLNVNSTGAKPIHYYGANVGYLPANVVIPMTYDGSAWEIEMPQMNGTQAVYVSSSGSDSTGAGTSASPWATLQYAVNQCPPNNNYLYNINILDDGSYNGFTTLPNQYIELQSSHVPTITSAIIAFDRSYIFIGYAFKSTAADFAIKSRYNSIIVLAVTNVDLKSSASGSGVGLYAEYGSIITSVSGSPIFNINNYNIGIACYSGSTINSPSIKGSGNTNGILANGGVVRYASVPSDFATTATTTSNGGRIYTGSQTSVPAY